MNIKAKQNKSTLQILCVYEKLMFAWGDSRKLYTQILIVLSLNCRIKVADYVHCISFCFLMAPNVHTLNQHYLCNKYVIFLKAMAQLLCVL